LRVEGGLEGFCRMAVFVGSADCQDYYVVLVGLGGEEFLVLLMSAEHEFTTLVQLQSQCSHTLT